MQKKLITLLTVFIISMTALFACSDGDDEKETAAAAASSSESESESENETEPSVSPVDINIACMKGPTAIGMIKLLDDSDNGTSFNNYNYTIVGTADEITTSLIKGELDVAAVPCNLASVLYNKTEGEIVTVAVNTLGVLYIVEKGETVNSVADLAGKTIYSTGEGTTPEYTLRYLLGSAGLDPDKDVNIIYKSEASEVVATLAQDAEAVAMLPQPYVTSAMINDDSIRIALDVTKEWEAANDGTVVTGVIVARKSFIMENKAAFSEFLKEYEASTQYANESVDETAELLEKFDVFKAAVAKKAIPYCNVTFMSGDEMISAVDSYLQALYDQNPSSIGGTLVGKDMFYVE